MNKRVVVMFSLCYALHAIHAEAQQLDLGQQPLVQANVLPAKG
jgi:hypothetical protein